MTRGFIGTGSYHSDPGLSEPRFVGFTEPSARGFTGTPLVGLAEPRQTSSWLTKANDATTEIATGPGIMRTQSSSRGVLPDPVISLVIGTIPTIGSPYRLFERSYCKKQKSLSALYVNQSLPRLFVTPPPKSQSHAKH
jgi:hypothetical protein